MVVVLAGNFGTCSGTSERTLLALGAQGFGRLSDLKIC